MKIAIIGGGVSGLATYLNLQKYLSGSNAGSNVTIYEPYDLKNEVEMGQIEGIPSSGGGYGVAPNGMASLKRIAPEVHENVFRNGFPIPRMQMKAARGWTLGTIPTVVHRDGDPECTVMVLRQVVIDALLGWIPTSAFVRRKVTLVEDGDKEASITLDDGDTEKFDLIIGADGVWSKARQAIIGDKCNAEYRGLFTVGGFVSTEFLDTPIFSSRLSPLQSQTVMTLGANGFFGYSPCSTGDIRATTKHIIGESVLPPGKLAFWWSRSAQKNPEADLDNDALHRELEERHRNWKDPTIRKIIENSRVSLKVPTWVLPKLPAWAGRRVVLVGDAAHALPSSSGQGVSQALEDAEALSMLLAHNLTGAEMESDVGAEAKALKITFKQYTAARKSHVEKVLDLGNKFGDTSREMGIVTEFFMCFVLMIVFRFFSGSGFQKLTGEYDVLSAVEKSKKQQS